MSSKSKSHETIYLFLFIIFANILFSQNYQNICTNGLTFYKDNANNIKAFRLDSMYLPGSNDTIFFPTGPSLIPVFTNVMIQPMVPSWDGKFIKNMMAGFFL